MTIDETVGSLWATRGLASGGFAPWLGASHGETYAGRSRASAGVIRLPEPDGDPSAYVAAVAAAASSANAAVVLPGTEQSLRVLTDAEEDLLEHIMIATGGVDALARATDKARLPELAVESGLATPAAIVLAADDSNALDKLTYPLVLKPLGSVQPTTAGTLRLPSTAAVMASDAAEARRVLSDGVPRIAQPCVHGELRAVAGVAVDGKAVCTLHQRSPRIWPPGLGGTTYAEALPAEPHLDAGVRRLVDIIRWSGIFHVQFLHNADGDFLIDVNPRVYGSIGLAIAAGLNLPAIWAEVALGGAPRITPYRPGTRYRVEASDARALLAEWRSGRRASALAGAVPRRRTAHGVFLLADPRPTTLTVLKAARRIRSANGRGISMRPR